MTSDVENNYSKRSVNLRNFLFNFLTSKEAVWKPSWRAVVNFVEWFSMKTIYFSDCWCEDWNDAILEKVTVKLKDFKYIFCDAEFISKPLF